jgi:hypothetical protein
VDSDNLGVHPLPILTVKSHQVQPAS